jgi:acyl-CoA thioester hydrolase
VTADPLHAIPLAAPGPRFHLDIEIDPGDIDELGHVSNLVYLRWVQEVATAHSSAVGYDQAAYRRLGAIFVVRRHQIDYHRPAYPGEPLQAVTWVASWKRVSSVRCTEILRRNDGVLLARASTLWAFVGLDSGRLQQVPGELYRRFLEPPSGDR